MTTKILALTDALGNLVKFVLMPGQRHDTICIQQCEAPGKHMVDGHRLCGLHLKTYQRRGELLLATNAGTEK